MALERGDVATGLAQAGATGSSTEHGEGHGEGHGDPTASSLAGHERS